MIAPIETGKVSVSLQRLRYLERVAEERDALKQQLAEAERERDSLRTQIAEIDQSTDDLQFKVRAVERLVGVLEKKLSERDAACAKSREALDLANVTLLGLCEDCEGERFENGCDEQETCSVWQTSQDIEKALSSGAGKDLLEQLNKANDIIRNLVDNSLEFGGQCYECRPSTHFTCDQCYMGEAHEYVRTCLKRGENDA